MEHGEREAGNQQLAEAVSAKKHGLLNKFLTKTYHMIDSCDPDIATWADGGKSFVIQDVKEFSKTVLPRFFKHSKFPSFVRQLNFYSFRKLRPAPDARPGTTQHKSVRFAHDFFRRGQPELLQRIQRITKSQDVCSTDVKSLKDEIYEVSDEMEALRNHMQDRFQTMMTRAEIDYQQHMAAITLSHQLISRLARELSLPRPAVMDVQKEEAPIAHVLPAVLTCPPTSPSPPPAAIWKHMDISKKSFSPTCVVDIESPISSFPAPSGMISPLMALSMIASIDHEQEFGR